MLVSLKAASLGVNLVSANHVVLMGGPQAPPPPQPLTQAPARPHTALPWRSGAAAMRRSHAAALQLSPAVATTAAHTLTHSHTHLRPRADLWYNPTVEEQAIDRAHRIGQTRPVHVTRITIEGAWGWGWVGIGVVLLFCRVWGVVCGCGCGVGWWGGCCWGCRPAWT